MPRKKKNEIVNDTEVVEGRVEGLTYSEEEQRIRQAAREKALAEWDKATYGSNVFSVATGQIVRNRSRNNGVRERVYTSGAELAGMIDAYWCILFRDQEQGLNIVPDVEHMAEFLGVTRDTVNRWERGEDNLEFVDPIRIAKNEIASVKKQRALTDSKVNSLLTITDLNNNHGYQQNQKGTEVNVNVRLKHDLPSIEQLNEQIKLLP